MKAQDVLLKRKIYAFLGLFVVLTLGLMAGAFHHQVLKREQYLTWARKQEIKPVRLTPLRGRILDRRGSPLALSLEVGSVFAHPGLVKNPQEKAALLSKVLGLTAKKLEAEMRKEAPFTWLARQIPIEKAQAVKDLELFGIGMEKEGRRYYPNRDLAGHIIGFAGIDSQGLEGLEWGFDSYLRGPEITLMLQHDAYGRTLWQEVALESARKAACELHLTLDLRIQSVAERAVNEAVENTGAQSGTAVVMDPRSGEVLAIACVPRFNPNRFPEQTSEQWRNRAIADTFEPGSTMKAILISAALQEGVVDEETLIDCEMGHFPYGGHMIHDMHPHGVMPVREVIAKSSNIGTAKIADQLEAKTLWNYLQLFGFGQATGLDLPGEATGTLSNWKGWAKITKANHAFGQGFAITAMQLANAFSVLANGGFLLEPYVVSRILDENGKVLVAKGPRAVRRVLTKRTADRVMSVLESVVEGGTGKNARIPGFRVAGKTGTAQIFDHATGAYSNGRSVVSFTGIVPADRPELVIAVVLTEPKGRASGGMMAAPVFRDIAVHSLHYRGVPAETPSFEAPDPALRLCASGVPARPVALEIRAAAPAGGAAELRMPNLLGFPLRPALQVLGSLPVKIGLEGSGTVVFQEPAPDAPIQAGQNVRIQASPSGWTEGVKAGKDGSKRSGQDEARGTSTGA